VCCHRFLGASWVGARFCTSPSEMLVSRTSGKSAFRSMVFVPSKMLQGVASKPSIFQQMKRFRKFLCTQYEQFASLKLIYCYLDRSVSSRTTEPP
jgi:hypothetical protein